MEEICKVITDGNHQAPPKSKNGIPFLVISDVISGRISFHNCRFVPEDYYNNLDGNRRAEYGDILFTVTGSYGKPIPVDTFKPFCFQRHIGLIKPLIHNDYLMAVLSSDYILKECNKTATGTAQKTVGLESIRNFLIPIPSQKEQEKICKEIAIYNEIIDEITANKEILTCAISLCKSKILDLAMQGKLVEQNPSDESASDMLRRINPKAKIITDNPHYPQLPDNWAYISLEDINEYRSKSITPANNPEEIFELYSVPTYPTGAPELLKGNEIGSSKQLVMMGDVLVCKINPHINRVWHITKQSDIIQIASSEWITVRNSKISSAFLKYYFESPAFRSLLCSKVSGVGGSLTRAQPAIVKNYLIPIPPLKEQFRIVIFIDEVMIRLKAIESTI